MPMTPTLAGRSGLAVLLALGLSARAQEAPTSLRWKPQAGETFRYEFRQKNEIKVKANGRELTNTTDLTMDLTWTVKGVARDGVIEITQVIDRVRAKVETGTRKTAYDSKDGKPNDDPVAQSLSAVYGPAVGRDYALRIDPRGRVVEARVPEPVVNAVRGSPFQALADGGSFFSERGLKTILAQLLPPIPEKPVARGETWEQTLDLPAVPLQLTQTFAYRLAGPVDNAARIEAKIASTIKPAPDARLTVHVKETSGTGAYALDKKDGGLSEAIIRQSLALTLGSADGELDEVIAIDLRMTRRP